MFHISFIYVAHMLHIRLTYVSCAAHAFTGMFFSVFFEVMYAPARSGSYKKEGFHTCHQTLFSSTGLLGCRCNCGDDGRKGMIQKLSWTALGLTCSGTTGGIKLPLFASCTTFNTDSSWHAPCKGSEGPVMVSQ